MRKRSSFKPYLSLIGLLLLLVNLPQGCSEKMPDTTVAVLSPIWRILIASKEIVVGSCSQVTVDLLPGRRSSKQALLTEVERLRLDNLRLSTELAGLRDLLTHERRLEEAIPLQAHRDDVRRLFNVQLQAIPARVLVRSASLWNQSLWINVGEKDNKTLGRTVIAKNSPVVLGTSVVGVIDHVGKRQSRVRLLTDPQVTPSVRSVRGEPQNRVLIDHIDAVVVQLQVRDDLTSLAERQKLMSQLSVLRAQIQNNGVTYHAKGELYGSSTPLWRRTSQTLRGTGFNYDFEDEYGPARDLRTGQSSVMSKDPSAQPILKEGDLLVTTGMDGVFPEGLSVAEVTHVATLREGAYYYDLEAQPTAGSLDALSIVYVLPPQHSSQ